MKIRLSSPLMKDSIVDGEGLRAVVWTQGCPHDCPSCHNPQTHSFSDGELVDVKDLKKEIDTLTDHDGLTLSGGEPMEQIEACLEIAKYCQRKNLNVWCYTGYRYEELMMKSKKNPLIIDLLQNIDRLIDGRFLIALKSLDVPFRGSKNQRIIDVKASLEEGRVIEDEKYLPKDLPEVEEKIYI